jgi:hypothetical protein
MGDNQRSHGIVTARNRSLGALDHQRRDLHSIKLSYLTEDRPASTITPCVTLRNMYIGDVCPKEFGEPPQAQDQPSSSNQASPPTQDEDQAQIDENEDQEDETPQEEDNDQGGDEVDQDKEDDQDQRPPHPRVHQAIQRDHPMNSILGDIHKG